MHSHSIPTLLSINQSIKFLKSQYPRCIQAQRWRSGFSVFNNKIEEAVPWCASMVYRAYWCLLGKGKVKEMLSWDASWSFQPKRLNRQTERGCLKEKGPWVKCSCTCVALDPRDWQNNSFVWFQCPEREWWGKHEVNIDRLFFHEDFCRSKNWSWTQF